MILNRFGNLLEIWVCHQRKVKQPLQILASKLTMVCFDKATCAEKINEFYTTVASNLVKKLPKSLNKFGKKFVENFYRSQGVKPNSYSFSEVSENKVLKYLNVLSVNKATGLDGISSRFVKESASIIVCPLTHVINSRCCSG